MRALGLCSRRGGVTLCGAGARQSPWDRDVIQGQDCPGQLKGSWAPQALGVKGVRIMGLVGGGLEMPECMGLR